MPAPPGLLAGYPTTTLFQALEALHGGTRPLARAMAVVGAGIPRSTIERVVLGQVEAVSLVNQQRMLRFLGSVSRDTLVAIPRYEEVFRSVSPRVAQQLRVMARSDPEGFRDAVDKASKGGPPPVPGGK